MPSTFSDINNNKLFTDSVVKATQGSLINYCRDKCPDQYVGRLDQIVHSTNDFPLRIDVGAAPTLEYRVVLILESPHINEFVGNAGPAKGKSGTLIRKYLSEVLGQFVPAHAGLFLVNAIQYQCSLGVSTDKHRDVVFRNAWSIFAQENFCTRLQKLKVGEPIFVVNACTKGKKASDVPTLQELVEVAIQNSLNHHSDLLVSHPVSWWSRQNRKPKLRVA